MVDEFYRRAQKGHIGESFLQGGFCAGPHAGALDVDADKVLVRILACQSHGILAFATAQFEDNGVVVLEKIRIPTALHRKTFLPQNGKGVLKDMRIAAHVVEFL